VPSLDKQSQYGKGKVFDVIWGGRSNEGIKIKIRGELVALDCQTSDNLRASLTVALFGSLATIICKPRQARKGATVVVPSCAEVWLLRVATISSSSPAFICL